MRKINSSILLSIFKRKGGEGEYTKIANEENINNKNHLFKIEGNEKELIIYYKNDRNWFLLSSKKVFFPNKGLTKVLDIKNIKSVELAINEEFKNGIKNKNDFSKLNITDYEENKYLLTLEKGLPYFGIYQVLHFIVMNNTN